MHLHPTLSTALTADRQREAVTRAHEARLVRATRCAEPARTPRSLRRGCPEVVPA